MIERILLPHDGSEAADAVIPLVRLLAQRSHAEVIVLRAADLVPSLLIDYPTVTFSEAEGQLADCRRTTDRVATELLREGVKARPRTVVAPGADAILDCARSEGASLVALATHGRTGLARWAFGSVTEKVIRASTVPTLVVRSFGEQPAEPTLEHILVPTSGGEQVVLPLVATLARLFGARVTLAHFASDYAGADTMPAAQLYLEAAAQAFAAAGVRVETALRRGDAARGILDYGVLEAAPTRVDLIAMATHGRAGLSRWLMGSVTEKVLRHALVPVLAVRGTSDAPQSGS